MPTERDRARAEWQVKQLNRGIDAIVTAQLTLETLAQEPHAGDLPTTGPLMEVVRDQLGEMARELERERNVIGRDRGVDPALAWIPGRVAPRFPVRAEAVYEGASIQGSGPIRDISITGVAIETADPAEPGAEIRIRFRLLSDSLELTLPSRIVRHTQHGFAAQFVDVTRDQQQYLQYVLPAAHAART